MAFNLKEMTIDYKKLFKMVPSERAAVAESGLINDMISALTPGQIVNLFPRYYREKLPDVGSVNQYKSGLDVALSGGTNLKYRNKNIDYPEGPTLDQMKAKLVESGINVEGIYETVGNGVLKNDPRVKFLNSLPSDKLKELGFEQFHDENGKTLIKAIPITVPEDVANGSGIGSVGTGLDLPIQRRKELVFNAVLGQLKAEGFEAADIRGVAALLAGQPEQESSFDPTAKHDKDPRTGEYTGYGLYGARLERRDKMFSWLAKNGYEKDDLIGQARYMAHEAVNDYGDVMKKVSGIELTKLAKEDPAAFKQIMLDFVGGPGDRGFESPADPRSGLENRVRGATDTFNMKEENVIAVNKETYMENMRRQREDKLSRELYNSQNAPTATPIENASGYVHPVTGKMMHDGHGGTSEFGYGRKRLHAGVDVYSTDPKTGKLRVGEDAPVRAPTEGTIVSILPNRGRAGNMIIMKDKFGRENRFLHVGGPAINPATGDPWKVGEKVEKGQTITHITGSGTMFGQTLARFDGDYQKALEFSEKTGWARQPWHVGQGPVVNKPHLHYELRENGKPIDPGKVFPEYDVHTGKDSRKDRMVFSNEEERQLYLNKTEPQTVPKESVVPPTMTAPDPVVNAESIKPKPPAVDNTVKPMPEQNTGAMSPPITRPAPQQQSEINPNLYPDMSDGVNHAPPSQYRAFNNARLYDPQSTKLYNGHFA